MNQRKLPVFLPIKDRKRTTLNALHWCNYKVFINKWMLRKKTSDFRVITPRSIEMMRKETWYRVVDYVRFGGQKLLPGLGKTTANGKEAQM